MVHRNFEKCATTKKNYISFCEVGSNSIVTLITFLFVFGFDVVTNELFNLGVRNVYGES
jgi:hypothetical protein